jgi:hypothetical protein
MKRHERGPDIQYEVEMKELLAALKEFLSAKLEKTLADTEVILRGTMGSMGCLYSILYRQHTLQMRESGLQQNATQVAVNEQNHEQIFSNIKTTASMFSFEELQSMLSRARDVQETGSWTVAAQLDAEESARTLLVGRHLAPSN